MGNNAAYSTFQHTIIALYDRGKLDLELLDTLAEEYSGTDIDSGGDTGLLAADGKTLEEICLLMVDPGWSPVQNEDQSIYPEPEAWQWYERYWKWRSITGERWGWG